MSFHFMALLKCFHLNHYWATWIVGINLPLCSAYNDRSSKGERVSVKTEESNFSCASHRLCICMPEYNETLLSYNTIYWKLLLHCIFHSQFDNFSHNVLAAVNTNFSSVETAVSKGDLIFFILILSLSIYVPGILHGILHSSFNLVLMAALWNKFYYLFFKNVQVTNLESGRLWFSLIPNSLPF